jgi:hypothetical protein
MWGVGFAHDASQLSPRHAASNSLDQFEVNDDGLLVAVGPNGHWTDGRWGTDVVVDGINYDWGMPIVLGTYDADGARTGDLAVDFGQSNPDVQVGFTNTLVWGHWNVFTQFTGQVGGQLYNRTKERLYDLELHADVDQAGKPDYAKKPAQYYTQNVSRSSGSSGLATGRRTDWFAEGDGYVKLAEAQLQYRINKLPWIFNAMGMKQGSVALVGRNLFSLTGYSGYDPEAGTATSRIDDIAYPLYRTISFQTQFTF